MNKIEQENNVLEGDVIEENMSVKYFKNLSAALDYVKAFNICNFNCSSGYTQDNKYVVQVQYGRINS